MTEIIKTGTWGRLTDLTGIPVDIQDELYRAAIDINVDWTIVRGEDGYQWLICKQYENNTDFDMCASIIKQTLSGDDLRNFINFHKLRTDKQPNDDYEDGGTDYDDIPF
jgi:hypothetical protein